MDTQSPNPEFSEDVVKPEMKQLSRRSLLKVGAAGAASVSTFSLLGSLGQPVTRLAHAAPSTLPDIQFNIGSFIAPAKTFNDGGGSVTVQFGPVYTAFVTATLTRTPSKADQSTLANALNTLESNYAFSPSGLFTFVSYGIPYFKRLPGGMTGSLVSGHMPRLTKDNTRFALEEAVACPTDVATQNVGITKQTYNVPVKIESNDVLFTLRSDNLGNLLVSIAWMFAGSNVLGTNIVASPNFSGLFNVTSTRLMFAQQGLPRKIATAANLSFASEVNPNSPMWMGFVDQQTNGAGPAQIVTFQGNSSAKVTTATSSDYFANGSIQHLSHVIQDLSQFYANPAEPFTERVQYMFRANPIPSVGNSDQFTNGGGPAFFPNVFQGTGDAAANAQGINTFQGGHRMGHLAALQRSSRAADGTPMHIRMDGPGFDPMDVPDGSFQPKLQFTVFVPSADFFTTMRANTSALDLVKQFGVADEDNGLERFTTATRRQNFLVPSRAHRAFPLIELT